MTEPAARQFEPGWTAGTPYLEAEIGIDALRDALAAVRSLWNRDTQGVHAVLANCDAPRHVAWYLTIFTRQVCVLGGLDDAGFAALMRELQILATDFLLDEANASSGEAHSA